jgi:hypothetical protein
MFRHRISQMGQSNKLSWKFAPKLLGKEDGKKMVMKEHKR